MSLMKSQMTRYSLNTANWQSTRKDRWRAIAIKNANVMGMTTWRYFMRWTTLLDYRTYRVLNCFEVLNDQLAKPVCEFARPLQVQMRLQQLDFMNHVFATGNFSELKMACDHYSNQEGVDVWVMQPFYGTGSRGSSDRKTIVETKIVTEEY